MKKLLILALTLFLVSCAAVDSCPDTYRDGGIGGTGECQKEALM